MEIAIPIDDISFDASAKTITITGFYIEVVREQILKIQNLTTGDTIYNTSNPNKHNISVSGGVITHTYDNPDQQDTDVIQVIVSPPEEIVFQHKYKLVAEGGLFRQAYKWDIESAAVAYMLIKVGSKYPRMLLRASADGDTTIEIYHTPTVTLDGDEEASGNYNFNSSNTSLTTWFPTPTIGASGTYIANTWILGGSGVGTPAGSREAGTMYDFDIILIPNVNFLIKFTNAAGRDIHVLFEAVYRETTSDTS